MRFAYLLIFAFCSLLFACKCNPNIQNRGEDFLQGVWEQDSIRYQDQLLDYTKHQFTFTCDSFYATMVTKAKVSQYPDSCFNGGSWTEYAKGKYGYRNDTLYLIGTFTKANFKQKISGCYRIGQYLPKLVLKERRADKLVFQDQHDIITLSLKQKIICDPKPL